MYTVNLNAHRGEKSASSRNKNVTIVLPRPRVWAVGQDGVVIFAPTKKAMGEEVSSFIER